MKTLVRQTVCLALTYCILAPLLLLIEIKGFGSQMVQQALPLVALSVFYFAYTVGELMLSRRLHRTAKGILTGYYMLMKVVRMILSILACVVYYLLIEVNILPFCINIFVLYIATMAFSTVCHVRMERTEVLPDKRL